MMTNLDKYQFEKIAHFLIDLRFNNERPWFKDNKARYDEVRDLYLGFLEDLLTEVKKLDPLVTMSAKESMYRIYRDVRFSKNKEPYKTHFDAFFTRGVRGEGAGYFVRFQPDNYLFAAGIYSLDSAQLKAIRSHIYKHPERYKEIINDPLFQEYFPVFVGDKLKLAPKGFPKDFPDIELIKFKKYIVDGEVPEEFWQSPDVVEEIMKRFIVAKPFVDFINEGLHKE